MAINAKDILECFCFHTYPHEMAAFSINMNSEGLELIDDSLAYLNLDEQGRFIKSIPSPDKSKALIGFSTISSKGYYTIYDSNSSSFSDPVYYMNCGYNPYDYFVTFINNTARGVGGAIYVTGWNDTIINSTFINSSSLLSGEAIYLGRDHRNCNVSGLFNNIRPCINGSATGIDIRKVIKTQIRPVINTGVAAKKPGVGQVGAGIVHPPMKCFEDAIKDFQATYMS